MSAELVPGLALEYAFSMRLTFGERRLLATPAGRRVYVQIAGGEIWGPRLSGRVMPCSGGDYADVYGISAHYMLEADDGTPIYVHNRGHLHLPGGARPAVDGPGWGEAYFRVCPGFDAPVGPHDWLTRTLVVGTGERLVEPEEHMLFTYYAVL